MYITLGQCNMFSTLEIKNTVRLTRPLRLVIRPIKSTFDKHKFKNNKITFSQLQSKLVVLNFTNSDQSNNVLSVSLWLFNPF